MKNKLALFAAILLGVIAAYGVHSYLKDQARRTESRLQPTAILAYNQRLAKGTVLMPSHVKDRAMSRDAITPAHMLQRDRNNVYGKRLIRDVETNSPILWEDFEERDTSLDQGESALRPGYRALTLAVDNVSGVAGNLRPGSHIDLYGTFQTAEESAAPARGASATAARARAPRTIPLLSDVSVLATDNRSTMTQYVLAGRKGAGAYSSITVAVTPREALMLTFAQNFGKITASLRPEGDVVPAEGVVEVTESNVLNIARELEANRVKRLTKKPENAD